MASKLRIISNAMVLLGEPRVTSINPTDLNPLLLGVVDIYDFLIPEMFSSYPWRFGMQVNELPQLADPPPLNEQYQFAYQLPPECRRIERVFPNHRYKIFQTELWSNIKPVKLVCVVQVPEVSFPAYFETAVTFSLIAHIAMLVTQNENIFQIFEQKADKKMLSAKSRDSQQQPNVPIQYDPLLIAHAGGTTSCPRWI